MTAAAIIIIKLHVPDLNAAEKFFVDAFGFQRVTSFANGEAEAEVSGLILALPQGAEAESRLGLIQFKHRPAPPPGAAVITLLVENLAEAIECAEAAGAKLTAPAVDAPAYGFSIASLLDPFGHPIELLQPMSKARSGRA